MGSVFMPEHYKYEPVTHTDTIISSLAWGFTLGFAFLTSITASKQTWTVWKRSRRITTYIVLIWSEMVVSVIFSFICWFYLNGSFPPSFAFFFSILTLWALQVQFLLQIIINRIGLLIPDKRKVWYIKWGVAAIITAINISVYNIWIPARLQIDERYVHINEWWDRMEKGIYLVIDGILNGYFLYLVKSRLLSTGMTKYMPLFRFNACIVIVSLSMDILIIAMMSLNNTFVYMQFHPAAYIVKLKIEMTMAELIVKIAREPTQLPHTQSNSGKNQSIMQRTFGTNRHSAHTHGETPSDLIGHEFNKLEGGRYRVWVTADREDSREKTVRMRRDTNSDSVANDKPMKESVFDNSVIVQTFETTIRSESMHISEREGSQSSGTSSTVKLTNVEDG